MSEERNTWSHSWCQYNGEGINEAFNLQKEATSEKSDTTSSPGSPRSSASRTPLSHFSILFSVHSFLAPFVPSLKTGALRAPPQALFSPYRFSLSFLIYAHGFNWPQYFSSPGFLHEYQVQVSIFCNVLPTCPVRTSNISLFITDTVSPVLLSSTPLTIYNQNKSWFYLLNIFHLSFCYCLSPNPHHLNL